MNDKILTEQDFETKTIVCVDCETRFEWCGEEQFFYYTKGLFPPKRCPKCRAWRKRTLTPPYLQNNGGGGNG